jgi:hypothetical protein
MHLSTHPLELCVGIRIQCAGYSVGGWLFLSTFQRGDPSLRRWASYDSVLAYSSNVITVTESISASEVRQGVQATGRWCRRAVQGAHDSTWSLRDDSMPRHAIRRCLLLPSGGVLL